MKYRAVPILLLILSVIATGFFIGCSSNNGTDEDNSSLSGYLKYLGYENCLICHTGGIHPIDLHCYSLDPVTYGEIQDESYSPKLSDCLACHLSHTDNIERRTTTLDCAYCHFEYQ